MMDNSGIFTPTTSKVDVTCKRCGVHDLWFGLLSARGDEASDATIPGVRWTGICRECGQIQDKPVPRRHRS